MYIYIILIFIILIANYYYKTYEGFESKQYRLGDMILIKITYQLFAEPSHVNH